jgi:uncharacterized protein (DUF983 family)
MANTTGLLLRRGLAASCPVCGGRGVFRRWVRMEERCPRCGLVFARSDGHWLGSWFLNICASQIVVTVIVFVGFTVTYPHVDAVAVGLLAGVGAVVAPILFFPTSRMLWTAIDLAMRPLDFDDGVAPGWALEHLHDER